MKVEHHLQAVAVVAEIFHSLLRDDVGFAEDHAVALAPLQEFAKRAQHREVGRRLETDVGSLFGDHERHRVHPEARDSELDPEPHDLQQLGLHERVGRIEVWLKIVEAVEVVGLGGLVIGPGRGLDAWKHHALVGVLGLFLRPDVPVAIGRLRVRPGGLEPGVLVGGVVDHEVDQYPHAALFAAMGELDKVAERSKALVDIVVVGDVVAVVAAGRGLERHQPDRGDAEPVEIVEPAGQSAEIADPVAVGIHEALDRHAVDDRVLVPEVSDHPSAPPTLSRGSNVARGRTFLMRRGASCRRRRGADDQSSLSIVIGSSRTRLPVAWKTAFATAAAAPTMPISPSPFTPSGFALSSSSTKITSMF